MASSTLVEIQEGKVLGKELSSSTFENKKYLSFQGIPYAQPPVGNLRFRDPRPVLPWEGVKDASTEAPSCPQKHVLLKESTGEEDNCLALNVYTPQLEGEVLPVMVWVHGGGFTFGSGNADFHDPEYWMEQGVVLVTCNYRVGALGFLSLGNADVPGNAGLKDQVMVLRWVQRNIAQFKGDPNNVTLFGESAGAASVHYHLLSPMSRGLFHRAILQSGCSLNPWSFSKNEIQRSYRLAEQLGCTSNKPREVLDFLQRAPVFDIVKKQSKVVTLQDKRDLVVFPFVPSKEPVEGEGERFLTEHPRTLLERGAIAPVPLIMGVNNKEGLLVLNDIPHSDEYLKVVSGNFAQFIPKNIGLPHNAPDKIKAFFFGDKAVTWETIDSYLDIPHAKKHALLSTVSTWCYFKLMRWKFSHFVPKSLGLPRNTRNQIKEFFFKDKPANWGTIDGFIDFFGDMMFYVGIDEAIRLHLSHGSAPVFCYNLSFEGKLAFLSYFLRLLYPGISLKGVCHADDLGYMFKYNIPGPPQLIDLPSKEPEHQIVALITGMWKQFALTGDPNAARLKAPVTWEPAVSESKAWRGFLELNTPLEMKHSRLEQRRMDFWDTLLRPLQQKL